MKLTRLLTGLAAALATATFIGLAAPAAVAQDNPAAPAAPAAAPAAPAATAPAAPAAAKPAPPATPACAGAVAAIPETDKFAAVPAVPAVLTNCTPSGGDTAWMLTSMALVLMMTIPGLGLFYGGMVRKKNVGDTVMTSFAITCLVTVLFAVVTYSLAFTAGSPFVGGVRCRPLLARHSSAGSAACSCKASSATSTTGASETQIRLRRRSLRPSICAS